MNTRTRTLTTLAMLCAISYAVMVFGRIPIVLFLKYDPKDVIIVIGGFIFGPLASLAISFIVSFIEMFTVSDTGIIGCLMNALSSSSFACAAALIYKRKHTVSGAIIGLAAGCLTMTGVMLLWNYFITPIYLGYPREAVAAMLVPVFLPFNLLKSGLNTAFALLLYKPVVKTLRKAKLVEISENKLDHSKKIGIMLVAILLLATCVFFTLILSGVI